LLRVTIFYAHTYPRDLRGSYDTFKNKIA